jgi:putative phosphoesterase
MRVVALYDIHGNLPALEAVLRELELIAPDCIVVGGDVASGPMPAATLDRLMRLEFPITWVRGNADRELVNAFDRRNDANEQSTPDLSQALTRWGARTLSAEHRRLLDSFQETATVEVDGLGSVLFCHGSPRNDEEILTAVSTEERLSEILEGVQVDVVVCGHTHHQFDRAVDGKRLVNAGSVGMPYEGTVGMAYWAVLGPEVELRSTPYDFAEARSAIRAAGFPAADEFITYLETVPTAEEAAAYFEGLALDGSS